jgi:hypothetical protein
MDTLCPTDRDFCACTDRGGFRAVGGCIKRGAIVTIFFRSGNHYVRRTTDGKFEIGISAPTISCKCPHYKINNLYLGDFDGLVLAIDNCICMAAKSLEKGSGVKIIPVARNKA